MFSPLAFGHVGHETFQVTAGAVLRVDPFASLPDPFNLTGFRQNSVGQLEGVMLRQRGLNIMPDTHAAYEKLAERVNETLANPARCKVEEIDAGGYKRWLVLNWRRQPSGAPKKMLL